MPTSLQQPNAHGRDTPTLRPSLPRSNSTNSTPSWHKNPSVESLRSPRTSISPTPLLRKRHSTYVLSTPPDRAKTPVPVPVNPPIRPFRNPARVVPPTSAPLSQKKSGSKSSFSNVTGAREEVTPWEFQPGPVYDETLRVSPVASSSSSPSSTQPRRFLATGPVSEVTPWEMYPVRKSATSRSSLAAGFVEEVMPWELHPVPTIMPNHHRSTLATGPVEDVTPWELGPTPSTASIEASSSEKRSSTRGSTSTNQGKSLSEITRFRRRKSTSAKAPKTRSTFFGSLHPDVANKSRHSLTESVESSTKSAPKLSHTTSSQSSLPPLTPPNGRDTRTTTPEQKLNFSTADRTIFEELKRNLEARNAQFVIKGEGSSLGSPLTCRGKKHHTFPSERAPYPRSYEREVIDLDVWETLACQNICESLTWHAFETPPTKVLDLGCGTGTWILNCARAWKKCHFVGLDIVPLQPDLHQVGSSDLASRITWVHTNFLEGLPFADGEFDFVHVKRIALGVPEDKWDGLFQEITRVMKPGGAFEMLEEDLFFPGKLVDSDNNSHNLDQVFKNSKSALEPGELVPKDSEPDSDPENISSLLSSRRDLTQYSDINLESPAGSDVPSFRSNGHSPPTPTTATFPVTPSRSNSPVADIIINEDMEKEAREILSQAIGDDYILPLEESSSRDQSLNDPLSPVTIRSHLQIKTPESAFASSIVSLNPSSAGSAATPNSESLESKARTRSRAHSLSTFLSVSTASFQRQQSTLSITPIPEKNSTSPPVPLLLRTIPKIPPNPRDHSLLEAIYRRLLESRFINMSPLALLANYVGFYFKDVRTHPPLQYHFPAISRENHLSSYDREDNGKDSEIVGFSSDDTDDDARDAILPSPVSRTARRIHSRRFPTQKRKEEDVSIGVQGTVHHSNPYITLDESRASALSPSIKGMFPDNSSALQRGSFFPNTITNFDMKTLNLHLALRTAEIVACSETMWEWVQKFIVEVKARQERQERQATSKGASRPCRSGSGSIEMPARRSTVSATTSSSDSFESSILDLTRQEFDDLINGFKMDMQDNYDIKNALDERFSWLAPATVSQEREDFEKACEKWDQWEQEQSATIPSHTRSHHQPRRSPTGVYSTTHHRSAAEDNHTPGRPLSSEKKQISTSDSPVSSLPIRRLSRAMRVFVAWKPYDTPSEDP